MMGIVFPKHMYYALCLSAIIVAPCHAVAWRTDIADSIRDGGYYSSIAIDASGRPHICHRSETNTIRYSVWNGATWIAKSVGTGYMSSIAIDAGGNPYIASGSPDNALRLLSGDNSWWSTQTIDTAGWCTSIAIDHNGKPAISYYDQVNGDLKYARMDGSEWQTQVVDGIGSSVGYLNSLQLNKEGNPQIAYTDSTHLSVNYASLNGTEWRIENVSEASHSCDGASLALDSEGNPQIVYYDNSNNYLMWAHLDGSSWISQRVDYVSQTQHYCAIALDSYNNAGIAYFGSDGLKYAHWNGSSWVTELVDNQASSIGVAIAIDNQDISHISYGRNGYLYYATVPEPSSIISLICGIGGIGSIMWRRRSM